MPTAALPLLHAILDAVAIPVLPPTLSATSPSLLLLVLERLLECRLSLSPDVRSCRSTADELSAMKCLLGVLADDLLGIDLTLVRPSRVVDGFEDDMAVVVMALAVVAKRRGIRLKLPSPEGLDEDPMSEWSGSIRSCSSTRLPHPIRPDRSYISDAAVSPTFDGDVFGDPRGVQKSDQLQTEHCEEYDSSKMALCVVSYTGNCRSNDGQDFFTFQRQPSEYGDETGADQFTDPPSKRTVLGQLMEEFGLN